MRKRRSDPDATVESWVGSRSFQLQSLVEWEFDARRAQPQPSWHGWQERNRQGYCRQCARCRKVSVICISRIVFMYRMLRDRRKKHSARSLYALTFFSLLLFLSNKNLIHSRIVKEATRLTCPTKDGCALVTSRSEIILIDCNRSYLTQSGYIRFPGRFIPSNSRSQQFSTGGIYK